MKEFIAKSALFIVLNVLVMTILVMGASFVVNRQNFQNWNVENNLSWLPKDRSCDLLILGASTARLFSRGANHGVTEEILQKKVVNLAQGGNGGFLNQKLYYTHYLNTGNKAKNILYVVDPAFFYSDIFDKRDQTFEHEPLDWDFLMLIIKNGMPKVPVWNYISSKLSLNWLSVKPKDTQEEKGIVNEKQLMMRDKWVSSIYPNGVDSLLFNEKARQLQEILTMASTQHSTVTIVFSPTLFGRMIGYDQVETYLMSIQDAYKFDFYDLTQTIPDKQMYYDPSHLNTAGLKKLLVERISHFKFQERN